MHVVNFPKYTYSAKRHIHVLKLIVSTFEEDNTTVELTKLAELGKGERKDKRKGRGRERGKVRGRERYGMQLQEKIKESKRKWGEKRRREGIKGRKKSKEELVNLKETRHLQISEKGRRQIVEVALKYE